MDSGKEDQMDAAQTVSNAAIADGHTEFEAAGALAFDCVCQAAIWGDDFDNAVTRWLQNLKYHLRECRPMRKLL